MKITDAIWEKRNLGVDTQEIIVEDNDCIENFKKEIKSLTAPYAVLKIPANKIDFTWYAEDNHFRFVESQLDIACNISRVLPEAEKLLIRNKNFIVETNNTEEMFGLVASKIKQGIFYTDRIALDPYFNIEMANLRYANWLLDMKDKENAHLQIMRKGNEIVAFNLNKQQGTISHGLIGGIFKDFQKEPLGLYWGASIITNLSTIDGITNWQTSVSSNNFSVIKIWEYLGMQVSNITSVFVRHV